MFGISQILLPEFALSFRVLTPPSAVSSVIKANLILLSNLSSSCSYQYPVNFWNLDLDKLMVMKKIPSYLAVQFLRGKIKSVQACFFLLSCSYIGHISKKCLGYVCLHGLIVVGQWGMVLN